MILSEKIVEERKKLGLSQEELAVKLNVVRQTVSKWEQGLSVPDADMLISISEVFETPVAALIGETVNEPQADDLKAISEKLEVINLQLAKAKEAKRKRLHVSFIILCAATVLIGAVLYFAGSPYLGWNFGDPETAVAGTFMHAFEWVFFRIAPFVLIGGVIGAVLTGNKK